LGPTHLRKQALQLERLLQRSRLLQADPVPGFPWVLELLAAEQALGLLLAEVQALGQLQEGVAVELELLKAQNLWD
jgi:hypothetical protein